MKATRLPARLMFFALLGILIGPAYVLGDERAEIVEAWQTYFQRLRSLKFEWRRVIQVHPVKEAVGQEWITKFALDGSKFRSEQTLPKTVKDALFSINAYDGQYYQNLKAGPQGTQLLYSKTLRTNTPYGGSIPVIDIFDFAFRETDLHSLETLQRPGTWKRMASRITKVEKAVQDGRSGHVLLIRGKTEGETYEVFVESSTRFPWSFKRTKKSTSGLTGQSEEYSSVKIVEAKRWGDGRNVFLFPLRIEGKFFRKGKVFVAGFDEVDSQSLKINLPVQAEIFSIPKSQATVFIDLERYEKRMAEQSKAEQKK